MSSDWQPLTELPDLRRVGIIALDIETRDDGLRAERGSAWPWRGGHVAASASPIAPKPEFARIIFRSAIPRPPISSPSRSFAGCAIWSRPTCASSRRTAFTIGAGCAPMAIPDAARRTPRGDRRARHHGRREPLQVQPRSAVRLARTARQGRKLTARGHRGARLVANKTQEDRAAEPHLAAAGALCRPLCRGRCGQHPAAVRKSQSGSRSRRHARRLSARSAISANGARDAAPRHSHRLDAAEQARDLFLQKRDAALAELSEKLGAPVGMHEIGGATVAGADIRSRQIKYPRTEKGNPSFTAGKSGWMAKHPHWLPQLIATANKYNNAATKFLESHILDHIVNGRIHAEINPHRCEEGNGTSRSRFSYTDPPLQQMPSRDKELAPLIRGVFLPEEGEIWAKPDISQQEFRFVVHYAEQHNLPQARRGRGTLSHDPDADFHALAATMTGLERDGRQGRQLRQDLRRRRRRNLPR